MPDDNFDLTRRKILGSLGVGGTGAAAVGGGMAALFTDEENSEENTITAESLDLEIDWTEYYNDELVEEQQLTNNPGPIFELEDVKPGDRGEATIGLHVYDNPAWVHMVGELTANDDNGLTEPESDVDDTGDDEGELADEIYVCAWYDGTDDDSDGGNNEYDDGEAQITAGTLREVLSNLNDGVLLENQTSGGGAVNSECTEGPKIDLEETELEKGDTISVRGGTVTITNVHYKEEDGEKEPIGFEWTSTDVSLCKISIFGGNRTRDNEYDCATSGMALSTFNQNSGKLNEISHFTLYYCDSDTKGDDCFPNSTTQYIGFQWMLPRSTGNEVQSDSVEFDLRFRAQQCRHNDEPENPYA